jgi:hypothetical protein
MKKGIFSEEFSQLRRKFFLNIREKYFFAAVEE